jgi:hemerythrin-like domain-containing protein
MEHRPMKATEILMSEHRLIEQMLDTLEKAIQMVEDGRSVRPGLFLEAADFIRGFADGCHHRKEEGVLFKAMAARGVPVEQGPIGAMLADHDLGRQYTRQIQSAAERLQAGELEVSRELVLYTGAYIELLRTHIFKEDRVLFPMAERALPLSEQETVALDFDKVEHDEIGDGIHEKYLDLVESLTRDVELAVLE